MPRYFFHLKDGHTSLDHEGTELRDLDEARRTAVTLSGAILKDGASPSLWNGIPWHLWVSDHAQGSGHRFFTLQFSAAQADIAEL